MTFFFRYVVVYAAVALALLGVVAYMGYNAGFGAATWIAVGAFALWGFGYHPWMLRRDYRRVMALIEQLRAGELDGEIDGNRVRESIRRLAVEYGGVPEIIAGAIVRRVVSDELVGVVAGRVRRRGGV
jgi:hypothetical protein